MSDASITEKQESSLNITSKELLRLSGEEALETILQSPMPARLIQSMAEEDLFMLVHDLGPEDALPVLSRASNDQWQFLLDMELWNKDRLKGDSVNEWFHLLLVADPQRFLFWGLAEQLDLLELHLFRNIDVIMREHDQSPSDFEDGFFTLDDVFYIRIRERKYYPTIRPFLEHLADHDLEKFHQVLTEIAGILPSEMEESVYGIRNVRLAEKGFLPFYEAVGIYGHLSPQDLLGQKPEETKITQGEPLFQVVPVSKSLLMSDDGPFSQALKGIQDGHILEWLEREFASLCNLLMAADNMVVRDKKTLSKIVRNACQYLDIGLQKLGDGKQKNGSKEVGLPVRTLAWTFGKMTGKPFCRAFWKNTPSFTQAFLKTVSHTVSLRMKTK